VKNHFFEAQKPRIKTKKPFLINSVKECQFRKNSLNIFIKESFESDFKELSLLNIKTLKHLKINLDSSLLFKIPKHIKPIGISLSKFNSFVKIMDYIPL